MNTSKSNTVDKTGLAGAHRQKPHWKHWLVFIPIVLVVVVLLASCQPSSPSGGGAQGECNETCHNPMDAYVEGYNSGDATLLVTAHAAVGNKCLDCHDRTAEDAAAEQAAYESGDFNSPLPMTLLGTQELCLGCHDGDAIAVATVDYGGTARNPHDHHYGDALQCYSCHRVHRASTMYCTTCHPDITGPEGWE